MVLPLYSGNTIYLTRYALDQWATILYSLCVTSFTDNGIPSEAPMHHQQVERELDDDLMLTDEDCQPMPPSAQESGLRSGQQEYYFSGRLSY